MCCFSDYLQQILWHSVKYAKWKIYLAVLILNNIISAFSCILCNNVHVFCPFSYDKFDSWLECHSIVGSKQSLCPRALHWCHNQRHGVSNHQPNNCLFRRLFRRIPKKTSKPRVTGLCAGNSPVTGKFPAERASNAENVPIWWRHHEWQMRSHCISFDFHQHHSQTSKI